MLTEYKTILEYARGEFVEKKSRFIGSIMPCKTEQEALDFIERIRKEFYDATHNVYAYIIKDENIQRCSDDGEPQGTAGKPTLDVLQKENITDICVVATRYYGGTMLGAGGLVRAYSKTSKTALDAAEILNLSLCSLLKIELDYTLYGKITHALPNYRVKVVSSDFLESVTLNLLVRCDEEVHLIKQLVEITNGKIEYCKIDELFEEI